MNLICTVILYDFEYLILVLHLLFTLINQILSCYHVVYSLLLSYLDDGSIIINQSYFVIFF